ncbi:MAG: diguanylate cyclase, partial [Clostridiales bacterium]|nr:diguanylate cyclase [Clostridiales bacterium]
IAGGLSIGIIYVDLDNFKAYNDAYGFSRGDRVIALTAGIIRGQVLLLGNGDDFIGHTGGDDFVIVTTPGRAAGICEGIIAEFDEKIQGFYSEEDCSHGCITARNRKGELDTFPLVSISLAIVTNERRELKSTLEIGDIAAEVRKKLKTMAGSNYFVDRRANVDIAEEERANGGGQA